MFEADEAAEGKGISASSFFPPDSFQRERRRKVKQIPQDLFTHRHHFNLRQPWQKLGKSYRHNSFLNFKPLQKKAALLSEQRGGKGNSLQSSMTSSPLVILLDINMCQPLQHDLEWFCPPMASSLRWWWPHVRAWPMADDSGGGWCMSLKLKLWIFFFLPHRIFERGEFSYSSLFHNSLKWERNGTLL